VVTVQDAGGNTVTGNTSGVTLALSTPAGATLACTLNPKAAVAGIATFAGCNVALAGTYTLTATDGALASAVSSSLTITAGSATRLAFVTQPSDSIAGVAFGSQPAVAVLDAGGNTVTTDTTAITLTLTVPGSAVLVCTTDPVAAGAGVATFSGCSVALANTYTLDASRIGLTSATSNPFVISPGAAAGLEMVMAPTGGVTGADWSIQPVLRFVDSFGNTATSSTDIATIEILFGPPAVTGVECSANPQAAVAGVVTFAHCTINTASAPPSTWSLHFTSVFGSLTAPVTEQ
jgi:hypothetical protein